MKILALDSTALTASVALCEDMRPIAEFTVNNGHTHSETLLPMIASMLKLYGCTTDEIDIFAASKGPGSFTGVRIGAATVKGLAFDSGKVCIGVFSLRALARNLEGFDGIICPVMNARRGQVYNALFDSDGKRLCEDRALSVTELADELASCEKTVYLCGDGTDMTFAAFEGKVKAVKAPERLRLQSAYSVAACAYDDYMGGVRTTDIELVPSYLRLSQAERERLERESGSLENLERKIKQ